jgi:four helix bundle protein
MQNYRKLRVYSKAYRLVLAVYEVTDGLPVSERYGLMSQMRRASISIVSNIAEGAGRGGADFSRFLRMALGSAFELDGQMRLCSDLELVGPSDLHPIAEQVSDVQRMLTSLMDSVRNSL